MSELCMNCFSVKGQYEVCPFCGYVEGTPPRQPHYLTPGTVLGNRFIVGTAIGVGGFGITYKCFDSTLGVIVAVKEFYPAGLVNRAPGESRVGLLSGDKKGQYQEQLQRFLLEAQSVAQFGKAKDIVNVFDFFEENGTAYIVMEYIDGVLLKDYLEKQGVIAPEAAMSIIMPIIEAVKKIHSKGIIHRDISPDNIFIADENTIKIFDFGAARLNNSKEGMAAEPVIKVGYSPLEQYRDKSRQGFYTDVYAVGAILYQMLTGVKPIESTEREFKDELKSPRELGVKVSANTDRAVMEALAVRPELRFQGIQEFQEALQNKRIAEYPKEKLRKKRRTRNWAIALTATAAMAVGVGIGLSNTVMKPHSPIFDTEIRKPTDIVVWVENDDQKEQIEELVKNGFKKGNTASSTDEKIQKMQQEDENVTVTVEKHTNVEKDLKEIQDAGGTLPNMFLTDHVSSLSDYKLVSLKDNVYASLDKEAYLFLPENEDKFGDMKEIPTGLDTLLLYSCQFNYNKDNTLEDSYFAQNGTDETGKIRLSDLIAQDPEQAATAGDTNDNKKALNSQYAFVQADDDLANTLLLRDETSWKKAAAKKAPLSDKMLNDLTSIQVMRVTAQYGAKGDKSKYLINKPAEEQKTKKTVPYGSNILAGVAYRKVMDTKKEKSEGINPLSDYKTYVVTDDDGRMLVEFSERYAITQSSSSDQQTACMRLLWVMLSESGQSQKNRPAQTTCPILRKKFKEFADYNANCSTFCDLVNSSNPCVTTGPDNRETIALVSGLGKEKTQEKIQAYVEAYQNSTE